MWIFRDKKCVKKESVKVIKNCYKKEGFDQEDKFLFTIFLRTSVSISFLCLPKWWNPLFFLLVIDESPFPGTVSNLVSFFYFQDIFYIKKKGKRVQKYIFYVLFFQHIFLMEFCHARYWNMLPEYHWKNTWITYLV